MNQERVKLYYIQDFGRLHVANRNSHLSVRVNVESYGLRLLL